jgi:predicted metal-binding protein
LYSNIERQQPHEADAFFKKARVLLSRHRKWFAWNKPAPLKRNTLVRLPERFKTLV